VARPRKKIDPKLVKALAQMQCTMSEIAAACECSVDLLERRFADIIKEAREGGKLSLRRYQWRAAEKGNVTMQIWLGKNVLGQKDKSLEEQQAYTTINLNYSLDDNGEPTK
jgi:hypothetical protein